MALDERYVPLTLLNEYFVDKDTATALANGTLEFYRDTSRNTPKAVYQLTTSGGEYVYTALPNPVTLNAAGTAQNAGGDNVAIYSYPYITDPATGDLTLDLYYIVCKDSSGTVQWTREAVPSLTSGNDPAGDSTGNNNELSNPQFSRYFLINDATTLTVSSTDQVFPIAPDWDLVASGTGTITVTRTPVAGNNAIPTYPSFYLTITPSATVTNPYLRQRLNKNSGLWSGTFLSGFVVAKVSAGANALTMKYQDSAGTLSDVTIFDAALTTSWSSYGGSVELDDSSNTQSGDDAYVDIIIELPLDNTTDITSLQVLSTDSELTGDVQAYDKRSANRDQALMGDYYIPRLEYKNVASLLVGWDFPLNPRQFGTTATVTGGTAEYVWDQTILQTAAGLTVDVTQNTKSKGISLNHNQADLAYALVQYLDGDQAAKVIGSRLSVNVNGYTVDGGNSAGTTSIQVKLFANSSASQFGTLPTSIFDLATNGTITLTASAVSNGWYEITRSNLPVAVGELTALASNGVIDQNNDVGFNNWVIEDNTQVGAGVQGFAIAVSFIPQASSTDYETQVDSISLTLGDIPTRPAPLTKEETLEACQYYYERSYNLGTANGATTSAGQLIRPQVAFDTSGADTAYACRAAAFDIEYNTIKRAAPTLTIYNPSSGSSNSVVATLANGSSSAAATNNVSFGTNWTASGAGTKAAGFVRATASNLTTLASSSAGIEGNIRFHFVANARIGG